MPEESKTEKDNQTGQQIKMLRMICTMTFLGSAAGAFSYGFIGADPQWFLDNARQGMNQDMLDLLKVVISPGRSFLLIMALLYAASFLGALLMWKLNKKGFHVYTLSQSLLLIAPLAFLKGVPTAWLNVIVTLLFIFTYSRFIRLMNRT